MRFEISTVQGEKFEMIGEPVDLPNNCGEVFVVHYNPFVKPGLGEEEADVVWLGVGTELFRVTHIGTGFRVSGGGTIDEAISRAKAKMVDAGEDKVRAVIERAAQRVAETEPK